MKVLRALVFGILALCLGCSKMEHVTIGGNQLCYPRAYRPEFDLTIWLMTHVGQNIPEGDEALIYIPAKVVKEAIPNYVVSHSNKYTPAVMHDLDGLVMGPSSTRANLAPLAWNIRASGEKHFIETDKRTGFTRIYTQTSKPSSMWHMVRSPPPSKATGSPPSDWYIGHCLELVGSYDCKQLVHAGNLRLEFDINERNLFLRNEINAYAEKQLQGWLQDCKG